MDDKELKQLIDKYLSGESSPDERQRLELWYENYSTGNKSFYNSDQQAVQASSLRSLNAVRQKLKLDSAKKTLWLRYPVWTAAASLLLFVSLTFLIYQLTTKSSPKYTAFSAVIGQLKQLKLPDGSIVWLNAGSTLRYSDKFNQYERDVYLNGEGYFDVVHNPAKPFMVHAGKLNTKVMGTAFAVSAYPQLSTNSVVVVRGKVQVSDSLHVLGSLLPNKQIVCEILSGHSIINTVNAEALLAWKDGKLVFNDQPMQDIAVHLQKWYGYEFRFNKKELTQVHFTASFNNNIALPDLLAIMSSVSHVDYRLDTKNKVVTFL